MSNEEAWYNKYAYQPSQALYGVSDGRALGLGLGRGYPESVPIADSDFIYAAVAEEMGLAGGAIIIAAFVIIVIAGMRVAIEARDMYYETDRGGHHGLLRFSGRRQHRRGDPHAADDGDNAAVRQSRRMVTADQFLYARDADGDFT